MVLLDDGVSSSLEIETAKTTPVTKATVEHVFSKLSYIKSKLISYDAAGRTGSLDVGLGGRRHSLIALT